MAAPARRISDAIDCITHLEIGHRAAELIDGAGAIAAEDVRQASLRRAAVASRECGFIGLTLAAATFDQNIPRAWLGVAASVKRSDDKPSYPLSVSAFIIVFLIAILAPHRSP